MCGIWAIFGFPDYFHHGAANVMKIAGRGPDGFRMETIPNFKNSCLAFHRLAVNGDSSCMQPVNVKCLPHLYLIYNGEIYNHTKLEEKYNFKVLTQCDGEIILHLYEKFGVEKSAQLLDGIFAFCIVDTKRKQVHLGRDTFGVRPLFTMTKKADGNRSCLVLCSEIKALVPIEASFNDTVVKLEAFLPGQFASYSLSSNGTVSIIEEGKYTNIGKRSLFEMRALAESNDHFENIRAILTEAVKKRLMSDRRIGCLLSGGLDSSLVASLLTKLSKEAGISYPIQTFAVGMEGGVDLLAARKVAEHIGSEHHEVVFTMEEGIEVLRNLIYTTETYDVLTLRGSVGQYLLSKYISEQTDTVVLYSGEGADELFQGYTYFHNAPSTDAADEDSRRLLKDMHAFGIARIDRATAVFGLETRVPFLDIDLTSYILSLAPELRQPYKGVEKWLLRQAFCGLNILPEEILWRPKVPFSAGLGTTRKSWSEIVQKFVSSEIPDEAITAAARLYPFNTPKTKEALYYRQTFEEFFMGHGDLVPYFWMPKWLEDNDN